MVDQKSILIKLREETGMGIMDIKKALEENGNDEDKARAALREKGAAMVAKKADRTAAEGVVAAYSHNGRIGVIVEVNCETDFVARNPDFQAFAHDLTLQISSMKPATVEELLDQEFIKDPSQKIANYLSDMTAKMGEKLVIARFARFELGETAAAVE